MCGVEPRTRLPPVHRRGGRAHPPGVARGGAGPSEQFGRLDAAIGVLRQGRLRRRCPPGRPGDRGSGRPRTTSSALWPSVASPATRWPAPTGSHRLSAPQGRPLRRRGGAAAAGPGQAHPADGQRSPDRRGRERVADDAADRIMHLARWSPTTGKWSVSSSSRTSSSSSSAGRGRQSALTRISAPRGPGGEATTWDGRASELQVPRQDSNLRSPPPEGGALSPELYGGWIDRPIGEFERSAVAATVPSMESARDPLVLVR